MWWGHSPALDLQSEINKTQEICPLNCLEVLILGAGDARHITKTIASSYMYPDCTITYHVIEPTLEQLARSLLLLSTCLDKDLGLQEATLYYMEILGNTLIRPATAKYLAKCCSNLVDIPSSTKECPWLSLESLKHKERDQLEAIFRFWQRAVCEHIPIDEYWDRQIRKSLKTRYDYRDGVFDWDYHMVLKPRNIPNLTLQEYRFWRNTGIAFTWIECEPIRSNPTFLTSIIQHGPGFIHYAYLGDITNGPFFTWLLAKTSDAEKKYRATDVTEREVMRTIHELKTKEPFCDELLWAHRDPAVLNGTIVTEMPNNEMERESWSQSKKKFKDGNLSWLNIQNHKVVVHSMTGLASLQSKTGYPEKFDLIWVAQNMTKHVPNLSPLLKRGGHMLVESRKYLVELRKEHQASFAKEVLNVAHENNLREIHEFDPESHDVARFCKM